MTTIQPKKPEQGDGLEYHLDSSFAVIFGGVAKIQRGGINGGYGLVFCFSPSGKNSGILMPGIDDGSAKASARPYFCVLAKEKSF
jgi:hypothetical protein